MNKSAFTLMEMLVVIILLVTILSLTIPMGSKIFKQLQKMINHVDVNHQLGLKRSFAFIGASATTLVIKDINYSISEKGVVTKNETSNVYR